VRALLVAGALLAGAVLFRLPALLNARDVNSDAAAVGLQAIHILHGEWSWFLWEAGYQSSLDSVLTAGAFAILGISPLVLALVPLVGYLIALGLAFAVLNRRIGLVAAAVGVLVLVIGSPAINAITVAPPRQWSITLVFLSIWLLDGAAASRRSSLRFAAGACAAALAVLVDLYVLLFVPGIALFALLCTSDETDDRTTRVRRLAACLAGATVGAVVVFGVRLLNETPTSGVLGFGAYQLRQRLELFWQQALPFALGYGLYHDGENHLTRGLRTAPWPWYGLQVAAGWSLVAGIAAGGVLAVAGGLRAMKRAIPWPVLRLGALGAGVAVTTLVGFVASTAPSDMWTTRYLGPIFWMAPFAIAPVAVRLGTARFAAAAAPYLIVAAIAVWHSYGFYVNGLIPRRYAAEHFEQPEQLVREFLRGRGIRYAAADYWFAYRFSFVFQEDPVIEAIDLSQSRHLPYRDAFRAQQVKAWVFHPDWSRTPMEACLNVLREERIAFSRHQVGAFTVIVYPDPSAPLEAPTGAVGRPAILR
jgi:hypothetical protein